MFICMQGTLKEAEPMRFITIRPSTWAALPLTWRNCADSAASSRSGQPSLWASASRLRACHSAGGNAAE
ncbi:hypothetical protein D9M68_651260 [compost metagenome]